MKAPPMNEINIDPFASLRSKTRARIALGRVGDALPTIANLEFQMAHAKARDAVHSFVDFEKLESELYPLKAIKLKSAATDRIVYLRRPDLGRKLADGESAKLPNGPFDFAFVIADGLSAFAVSKYATKLVKETIPLLDGLSIAPIILANQGRVAIGDDIAEAMNAKIVVILIGERPGLSSAESLGAYITYGAKTGTMDSARNCISNIHDFGSLTNEASHKIAWLTKEALKLGLTGIGLKEAFPTEAITATTQSFIE